ncbi:HET-domain-containing protein, partial [Karstenula rhodostoma CBS 690.94]
MRLINAHTKRFEEFFGEVPPYAILSHTWDAYEIPFKDFYNLHVHEENPQASQKIYDTCNQALEDELDYVWIDSCCIDKSSSAELSEAINSMYIWYSKAQTCYVYLSDYDPHAGNSSGFIHDGFEKCRWFTRGWTVQELLAPHHVEFYDKTWSYFGTRKELASTLSNITRVPTKVLDGSKEVEEFCVAQKMAWAARRQTTREEDTAYCLFGLFQINAPLLYGEGGVRAFERLQEEIIKKTNDLTIFAWMNPGPRMSGITSVLAPHPRYFSRSQHIRPQNPIGSNPEFKVTNKGLKIKTFIYR